MNKFRGVLLSALFIFFASVSSGAQTSPSGVPIVLAAFGTSTKAGIAYEIIEKRVKEAFPGNPVYWAFTSEIIRKKMNSRWESEGKADRLYSLFEVLSKIEAEGVKTVVVQPLHIFPGEEYEEVLQTASEFPSMSVLTGGALFQKWEDMYEIIDALERDFLPPGVGSNIIVAHGTPSTDKPSNIAILGLDRYLSRKFPNVFLGAVDGVVTKSDAIESSLKYQVKKARFIPLMLVAGDHIMNDIMGDEPESWKSELERGGVKSDCPTVSLASVEYYKGLGFLPETSDIFIRIIKGNLSKAVK